MTKMENVKIGVIGLGYVGLPLAVEFAKKFPVVGFDINHNRVDELNSGNDSTLEVTSDELKAVLSNNIDNENGLVVSTSNEDLKSCNVFVITVPTPIDSHRRPVLTPLIKAGETVGKVLKKNDVVIYESTVYPGATEEDCIPVLERVSGMKFNVDFFAGYSPERINPGDKEHTVATIKKVTSGSTPEIADFVDAIYLEVIKAGTHKAPTMKVAEAAKVIENSQRDINIAFVNELAKIFELMEIDTNDVIDAASTKWNFLPFKPGLVGGHCIGVDPYYLAQKAQEVGYHPEIILAGRRLNDSMGRHVASSVVKLMNQKGRRVGNAPVLLLGITFKENCPDIRNTKITDIYRELTEYGCNVTIYDPWANADEVKYEYGIDIITKESELEKSKYKAIVLGVAHREFATFDIDTYKDGDAVIYDVKGVLPKDKIDRRL